MWLYISVATSSLVSRTAIWNALTSIRLKRNVPDEVLKQPDMYPLGPTIPGETLKPLQTNPDLPAVDVDALPEPMLENIHGDGVYVGIEIFVDQIRPNARLAIAHHSLDPYLTRFPFFAEPSIGGANLKDAVLTIDSPWYFGAECFMCLVSGDVQLAKVRQRITYSGDTHERVANVTLPKTVVGLLGDQDLTCSYHSDSSTS